MRFCKCGCGDTLIGKQKFASGACQKRAWRAANPQVKPAKEEMPIEAAPTVVSACKQCGGWQVVNALRPFICDDCAGLTYHEAPLLRLALRESDNPMRAVMVYFGPMNVYSRWAGPHLTEIVCGVEEVRPLLRWLTHRLHGKVTSNNKVFVSLVPTEALVSEAVRQAGVKEAVAA